jgi:protein-tyrosine phosphatase
MPPTVIHVGSAPDVRDVVHRAVQALAEGKIVAFPTETVYGVAANARIASAVERLADLKDRKVGHPLSLAVKSAEAAFDYIPAVSSLGRRLARRCWPGPVTLVLPDSHPDSLIQKLPASVREKISPSGRVGIRVPGHQLILDVLHLMPGPLALTSANRAGMPDSVTADQVVDALGDDVDLVLDDGKSQFGQPSSVVQVDGSEFRMLRKGVVSDEALARLSSFLVVLVCTGNTCRSPMAEMLCKKQVAARLNCKISEVEDRGVIVSSAGIAAGSGGRPAPEAVQVMADSGLDLREHVTQPLSDRLVRHADLILTMTNNHRHAIVEHWPDAAERTYVLSPDGVDVSDPIGGPRELYRRCAEQIDSALNKRVQDFELP